MLIGLTGKILVSSSPFELLQVHACSIKSGSLSPKLIYKEN